MEREIARLNICQAFLKARDWHQTISVASNSIFADSRLTPKMILGDSRAHPKMSARLSRCHKIANYSNRHISSDTLYICKIGSSTPDIPPASKLLMPGSVDRSASPHTHPQLNSQLQAWGLYQCLMIQQCCIRCGACRMLEHHSVPRARVPLQKVNFT